MTRLDALVAGVDTYARALHGCDVELLDTVFDPAVSLFDVDEGAIRADPYPLWREVVAARRSPANAGQERDEEILSIVWLSPECATVHLRIRILAEVFVDHLTFAFDGTAFRIVAKTWHLEKTLPAAITERLLA